MKSIRLDPRTLIILLSTASVVAFLPKGLGVEIALVSACALLQVACGYPTMAIKWSVGFVVLVVLLNAVLPVLPITVSTVFTISLTYARKIYLCLMVGALAIRSTTVHRFTTALQSWHIPQTFLIPLSITIRYFPMLKSEAGHIRDAMKLKEIPPSQRIECFTVPLIMSATMTADELSAAAVTRGIENPIASTSTERLRMHIDDWLCLAGAVVLCVVAIALA